MDKGLFISLEGGEGTGKSTLVKLLRDKIDSFGRDVVLTREPGGNKLAEDVRKLIMDNDDISTTTELLLFSAARADHTDKIIRPALEEGKVVITDRFTDSTIVYQGYVKGVNIASIKKLNKIATGFLEPRLTFILELDVEEALLRLNGGDRSNNRFDREGVEFHELVKKGYQKLGESEDWKYEKEYIYINVNGKTPEQVVDEIFNILLKYIETDNEKKENYCVVCGEFKYNDEVYSDLGSFNSVICEDCKDTDEAKESLGME